MNSVQSVPNQTNLSRKQRRRHRNSADSLLAAIGTRKAASFRASSTARDSSVNRITKACKNIVPIIHGIVISNISLVLLQKEYIEQFYFEKRNGGGGPDPDAYVDLHRLLNKHLTKLQRLRFG